MSNDRHQREQQKINRAISLEFLPYLFLGAPLIFALIAVFDILTTSLGLDGVWLY